MYRLELGANVLVFLWLQVRLDPIVLYAVARLIAFQVSLSLLRVNAVYLTCPNVALLQPYLINDKKKRNIKQKHHNYVPTKYIMGQP